MEKQIGKFQHGGWLQSKFLVDFITLGEMLLGLNTNLNMLRLDLCSFASNKRYNIDRTNEIRKKENILGCSKHF